jgi:hypothetical protein
MTCLLAMNRRQVSLCASFLRVLGAAHYWGKLSVTGRASGSNGFMIGTEVRAVPCGEGSNT